MDTEDPAVVGQNEGQKKGGGKGKKNKKSKKISLDEFLASKQGDSGPAAQAKSNNWAVMTEDAEEEGESNYKFDRSLLPSAPKAAMGPSVDLSLIPTSGPFSAYIGNLSYDAVEEDLQRLFCKLEIDTVRIITDGGRPRGYAYVDFLTKESLIEALSYNEREYMSRNIRVDLATDKNQDGRGPAGTGNRSDEPDRTEGDWRRKAPGESSSSSFGPRREDASGGGGSSRRFGGGDRERGGFGDRDRDRDRGFGDRDRDRERGGYGFSGSSDQDKDWRSGGDRDKERGSFGGDRDRSFGGGRDRDRGFGGDRDRDRGFGGGRDRGFGGDRDRDRERGSYGGDRDRDFGDRGSRFGGSRGGGYERRDDYTSRQNNGSDRGPRSRDGSRDGGLDRDNRDKDHGDRDQRSEGPKERPVLKLQPRSTPVEKKEVPPSENAGGGQKASSIFGSAKPVNTYAKEKEIEEKLKKKENERDDLRRDDVRRDDLRRDDVRRDDLRRDDDSMKPRRHADDTTDRRRKSSSGSGGSEWSRNVLPVQKPPPHVGRSSEENAAPSAENPKSPTSPTPSSSDSQQPKMVPAPLPKQNPWGKKTDPASSSSSAAAPASRQADSSNNASSNSSGSGGGRSWRDEDRHKPPAGRGSQPARHSDHPRDNRDRRPAAGPGANGDGGRDHPPKKHPREKQVPKSIEDMPKLDEGRAKDFSTVNKFSFLMDNDNEDSNEENSGGSDANVATS